jgi:hypothetical protein
MNQNNWITGMIYGSKYDFVLLPIEKLFDIMIGEKATRLGEVSGPAYIEELILL